jgi:hypothetical protein
MSSTSTTGSLIKGSGLHLTSQEEEEKEKRRHKKGEGEDG